MAEEKKPKFVLVDDVKKGMFGEAKRVTAVLPPHTERNDTDDYKYEIEEFKYGTHVGSGNFEIVSENEIQKAVIQDGHDHEKAVAEWHARRAAQKAAQDARENVGGKRRKTMKKGRKMRRKTMKKGRKMRRKTMKGGNCDGRRQQYGGNCDGRRQQYGGSWFSSEPKSWDEWANAGKSEAARELKAAEGTNGYGQMKNMILVARDRLIEKGELPESSKNWEGGKKKRKGKKSRKMTKKRSRKMKGGKRDCDCH